MVKSQKRKKGRGELIREHMGNRKRAWAGRRCGKGGGGRKEEKEKGRDFKEKKSQRAKWEEEGKEGRGKIRYTTNLWNKGLISEDRSNKATLPLTAPRAHSSRLQRIHPRPYLNFNASTNNKTFPPSYQINMYGSQAEALFKHN